MKISVLFTQRGHSPVSAWMLDLSLKHLCPRSRRRMQRNAASMFIDINATKGTEANHYNRTLCPYNNNNKNQAPQTLQAGLTFSKTKNKKQPQSFSNHYSERLSADTSKNSEKSQVSSMVHHRH
ncbi:uncharacterized protein tafa5l isoform X2 [Notolabrus celidotus]|uniref:uncharacterized protein tafa5l isoform X2 n=1 Tax=Notolabrus celidotus TaxID=1203425 RepID=UPI00148F5E3E|nr:uncharacterized protein tafa5l isoform X2 [Notolabrus celidotus]